MRSVMRSKATVTYTRAAGPAERSAAWSAAMKPLAIRLSCGVELSWIAPIAQWWLVTTRPLGETKLAVKPLNDTIEIIGGRVRLANAVGAQWGRACRSWTAIAGSCEGINMPSSAWAAKVAVQVAAS